LSNIRGYGESEKSQVRRKINALERHGESDQAAVIGAKPLWLLIKGVDRARWDAMEGAPATARR
jgi:hypothetical protein